MKRGELIVNSFKAKSVLNDPKITPKHAFKLENEKIEFLESWEVTPDDKYNQFNNTFESLDSIDDSVLANKHVTSLKSKWITDLYSENAHKLDIPEFFCSSKQDEELIFAWDCNSSGEFKLKDWSDSKFFIENNLKLKTQNSQKPLGLVSKAHSKSISKTQIVQELSWCKRVVFWIETVFKGDYNCSKMKQMYEGILESPDDGLEQSIIQIKRDVNRTYPTHPLFKSDSPGFKTLENLLIAYSKYDRCIGYVQGMNFIMGSLMYHCTEPHITFWLFVSLIEQYQLWDNYCGDLKGVRKHWDILKLILDQEIPKLSEHFDNNEMKIEMFAIDWILGLFSSIIPIQYMGKFYDNFFTNEWYFFYKVVMVFLKDIQTELLQEEEMWDVLVTLKTLATPLRSDNSPISSHRNFKSTVLSTLNKGSNDSEVSSEHLYFESPQKKGTFSILQDIVGVFTKKQYDWDWMSILNRARTYNLKFTLQTRP